MPIESERENAWFASRREQRLWILTIAVVFAIYATLGLASTLAEWIQNRRLFDWVFVVGFLLMGLTFVTQGLRVRPRRLEVGLAIGIAAVYLMVLARLGIPERSHLFEYGMVAILIYEALLERKSADRDVRLPALLAILLTILIGACDEFIQLLIPTRVFDWIDIAFNSLAAFMSVTSMAMLRYARLLTDRVLNRHTN